MKCLFTSLLAFCFLFAAAQSKEAQAAAQLAFRVVPRYAPDIAFIKINDSTGKDVFEIITKKNNLIIKGTDANAMAAGLNFYLKKFCNTDISWYKNDVPKLPRLMPEVSEKITRQARCSKRFFLNYCTFGYTMPWWQWSDWQWFIDWMALNGINMPLAITGQEAIWYKVWKKFGLTDEDIRSYFTGPAYLPWHRMSNIDHWDGPLPLSWINGQLALQKNIVARERELGMKPVLSAFSGHVLKKLQAKYPQAKITSLGEWSGFSSQYDSYFLDPFDSLFKSIQKAFLQQQSRTFGTDHIYGADPFNEVTPPSWEPSYLADAAKNIYASMQEADAQAEWLQMGWIFYNQRDHWTNERIKAYLTAVPQGKMIMLDYFCDKTEVWKFTNSFYGQPFIWCYLGNFGGNTMLQGDVRETEKRMELAFDSSGANMQGAGSTTEGFGVNPFIYEYVFDKAWSNGNTDVTEWVNQWAQRRFGKHNDTVIKAWNILLKTAYSGAAGVSRATLTNARPGLTGHNTWTTNPDINYSNKDLLQAWKLLCMPNDKAPSVYYYDVTDVGRQVLGNYFLVLRDKFTSAYFNKNLLALKSTGVAMLSLLDDMDTLLATNQNFLLGTWIEGARKMGATTAEKNYFERDARRLITVWGEPGKHLTDYANRSLAGLTKAYYKVRWQMFIDEVQHDLEYNHAFNDTLFAQKLTAFEDAWSKGYEPYHSKPHGDCIAISNMLIKKYEQAITE